MKRLLIILCCLPLFSSACLREPVLAESGGYDNLETVLNTFADSRKTRDLKEYGSAQAQEAFVKTIENEVYKPVDRKVVEHLKAMPEFEGKRILTHDFRTPGTGGEASVNTDRDVRVLVEVELDRWVEVPVQKWEDVYYREFAKRTGLNVTAETSMDTVKEHAAKYRQLPTDRFHIEAGRDYSDAGTIKAFQFQGETRVLSTPNVVRVKRGATGLTDPEGLAKMYLEKADEQYRRAREIEQKLKRGAVSPDEAELYREKQRMHEIEGTVQLRKGVETLEKVRAGYQKQGYDVGELPKKFRRAVALIKDVKGTSDTDIGAIKAKISALKADGLTSLNDLNQKLGGQIESLKLAKQYHKPQRTPDISLNKAGKAAGIAGDLLAIKDSLEKAKQGNHLFINFAAADGASEKAVKTMALAALELAPIPVGEAMERGWEVDEEEREYLRVMVEHGESGDWKTNPITSMARVSTKIIYRTAKSMTLDPLIAGKTALEEGYRTAADVGDNFIAAFSRLEAERLQKQKFDEYVKRSEKFTLGAIDIIKEMRPLYGEAVVSPGDRLTFVTGRNQTWNENYQIRWELGTPEGTVITLQEKPAFLKDAEKVSFTVPVLGMGEYMVRVRVFERAGGLQAGFAATGFKMSERTELGEIIATRGDFDGEPIRDGVTAGEIVAFKVAKIGAWTDRYWVEWLVNGERYKYESADNAKINLLRFTTDQLKPGNYKVAVRILEKSGADNGSIIAHQSLEIRLKEDKPVLPQFDVAGCLESKNDTPLKGITVQNGDVLRFSARVPFPQKQEPVMTRLIWQVYYADGRPVPGLAKEIDAIESGITKEYRFRFRPDHLSDGQYIVALTHLVVSDSQNRRQAQTSFHLLDKVKIDKLLVTDEKERQIHREILRPGKSPLLYAYYTLTPGSGRVRITLTARYRKSGKVIQSVTVTRPREGEKPPYRVGLGLPSGAAGIGEDIDFEVRIAGNDGRVRAASRSFRIEPYNLGMEVPDRLKSGQSAPFKLIPPPEFKPPFRVEFQTGNGLGVGHTPGRLDGVITGIATKQAIKAALKVKLTDAQGLSVEKTLHFTVQGLVSAGNPQINQALIKAVQDGNVQRVRSLLDQGAGVNWKDDEEMAPLHYAADRLRLDMVTLLVEYGADVNQLSEEGPPLYHAAQGGRFLRGPDYVSDAKQNQSKRREIVGYLIGSGAGANTRRPKGRSPLWAAAAWMYDSGTVKMLLDAGAAPESGLLREVQARKESQPGLVAGNYCGGGAGMNGKEKAELQRFIVRQYEEIERLLSGG
jgi:hypothetical protein